MVNFITVAPFLLLLGLGEESDELFDAFEAGGGFLDNIIVHFGREGVVVAVVVGHDELHGHAHRIMKRGAEERRGEEEER